MNFSALKWAILPHFMVVRETALLLWTGCQETQMNDCYGNLNTCFTELNDSWLNKILVAMENFEKCTVAMLGGPCSQHVTGNTSRLNQLQSAIMIYNTSPPRMFLSLDLLWEYRIQHGANGPLYVTSSYSTWIFCRGVSGFATDSPCGVWCRGLTTCLLHVGPPFGNRIFNNSLAVGLT